MTIAPITALEALPPLHQVFLQKLREAGFQGDIQADYASRTVLATDNSIYQRMPQAVLYPKQTEDLCCLATLLAEPAYQSIVVSPRGGGTGTNGQSLTDGIVVDLSKHMNQILDIDVEQRRVRVQAGVVKDQLNAALKPFGLFFAPELSTSNRATIGGMINTDASGQGSCTYGKTRDHVLELCTVLLGGQLLHSKPISSAELDSYCEQDDKVGQVYRTAHRIATEKKELIDSIFPPLNRCLTGYDLAHLVEDEHFNLNSVICGSEGTLGFVVEATLNVLPIPTYSVLVNVQYGSFMDALRDASALMALRPLSIETVDSKVLQLAMEDMVWQSVSSYFPAHEEKEVRGINLVEFSGDSVDEVNRIVADFIQHLQGDQTVERLGHTLAQGAEQVNRVYGMRKRAVGLLGNVQGEARPQPFVEDVAVPPENLAEFIAKFREILDSFNLQYGMFGHVDAGVLHVRPALDMKDPEQAALIRPVSDQVAALAHEYGGLLWGEHGKGVRSEYVPHYFGELYPSLQELKAAFDPGNQLNPGKIATPSTQPEQSLLKIDEVPLRGEYDRQMPLALWQNYGTTMHCNGNGACYNYDPDDAMCPSWKATRQRVHSPKGRASLMREWLRLQSNAGVDVLQVEQEATEGLSGWIERKRHNKKMAAADSTDFSHEVYDAMAGCLACKSCVGQCPVKVNIPEVRSRFLQLYHQRYARPVRDYLIASLEYTIPYLSPFAGAYNWVMRRPAIQRLFEKRIGMVDSPLISRMHVKQQLQQWGVKTATVEALAALSAQQREKSVVLVQDAFTRYFEPQPLLDFIELCTRLGYQVWMAPFHPNGKPLHVQGFRKAFVKAARRNAAMLQSFAEQGVALVGLEPAMTLAYRQEYQSVADVDATLQVQLPQEWLLQAVPEQVAVVQGHYRLLPHCTEKTNAPYSPQQWIEVFKRFGLTLSIPMAGCCGMSGTYGHEARNKHTSKVIFEQSWAKHVAADSTEKGELLATGYSCRCQTQRFAQQSIRHPMQALLAHLRQQS